MFSQIYVWLHWGVDPHLSYTTQRKILHTNIGALLAIASLLFYAMLFALIGNQALINVIYSQLPFYPLLALIPHLNKQGWHCPARWILTFAVVGSQIAATLITFGSYLNSYYSYILFALASIVIFPLERWKSIAFIFAFNITLFLYFEFNWIMPAPELLTLDTDLVREIRQLFPTTSLASVLFFMAMVEFVTARSEEKLERLTITDVLTELPNRRYFENTFKQEAAKSQRSHSPLSLAILDIDHFKQVNDSYGHDVGDKVLVHIAQLLRKSTRAGNLIARIGGEEFALLLPDTHLDKAVEAAERIRIAVATAGYVDEERALPLTISIGITTVDCDSPLAQSYKSADEALYAAKHLGRNRVEVKETVLPAHHSDVSMV